MTILSCAFLFLTLGHKLFFMEKGDNVNNLVLCPCQFYIRHHSVNDFKIGEKVFLKSSPEVQLTVIGFRANQVECSYRFNGSKRRRYLFVPETIIQYHLAFEYSIN